MPVTRRRLLSLFGGVAAALGLSAFWASRMRDYDGPVSDHFDGTRFFDPDGSPPKSLAEVLRWQFGPDRQDYIEQTTAAYVAAYKKRNAVAKALSRRFGLAVR